LSDGCALGCELCGAGGKFVVTGCDDQRVGDPRYPDPPLARRGAGSLREDGVFGGTPKTTGETPVLPIGNLLPRWGLKRVVRSARQRGVNGFY